MENLLWPSLPGSSRLAHLENKKFSEAMKTFSCAKYLQHRNTSNLYMQNSKNTHTVWIHLESIVPFLISIYHKINLNLSYLQDLIFSPYFLRNKAPCDPTRWGHQWPRLNPFEPGTRRRWNPRRSDPSRPHTAQRMPLALDGWNEEVEPYNSIRI